MVLYIWPRPSGHLQISIIISTGQISTYGLNTGVFQIIYAYKIYYLSLKPKPQAIPCLVAIMSHPLDNMTEMNLTTNKTKPQCPDSSQGQNAILILGRSFEHASEIAVGLCPHVHGQWVCLNLSPDNWMKSYALLPEHLHPLSVINKS